ncbi:hypothetical protein BN80_220 [Yersinia phage phiR1-RT]|uniref:Uncharacterized protein n=1 Tax=Yersinia phage phiR1-RT TaxID=1206558 RepID=I7KRC8_BPPR1|nr:hypothetical protein BN80_220 [Yersinia phage phiR1-RT]CCI88790.1 hypothetical protein BN80_220 [Yersinia phage phiR1-RT]
MNLIDTIKSITNDEVLGYYRATLSQIGIDKIIAALNNDPGIAAVPVADYDAIFVSFRPIVVGKRHYGFIFNDNAPSRRRRWGSFAQGTDVTISTVMDIVVPGLDIKLINTRNTRYLAIECVEE